MEFLAGLVVAALFRHEHANIGMGRGGADHFGEGLRNSRRSVSRRRGPCPDWSAPSGCFGSIARALRSDSLGFGEVSPLVVIVSQVAEQTGILGIGLHALLYSAQRARAVTLGVVQHRQVVRDGFQARIVASRLFVERNGLLARVRCFAVPPRRPNRPVRPLWEEVPPRACLESVDSPSEDVVMRRGLPRQEPRAGATHPGDEAKRSEQQESILASGGHDELTLVNAHTAAAGC